MSLVFLEYFFLFDPVETWQHVHQFEQDFGKFLLERGLEANIIEGVGDKAGKRVLFINKKETILEKVEAPKMKSKKRLKTMKMKREGGKFVQRKRSERNSR